MSFIGKNIRKIRTIKKLSQQDFAKIFNLARPSVGAYEEERAEPKIDTVIQIAQYFGLSVDVLLTKELTINELYKFDIFRNINDDLPAIVDKDEVKEQTPVVYANHELEYIVNFGNKDFINNLPSIQLPNLKESKTRAFEVEGAEMEYNNTGLHNGDILLCIPADKTNEEGLHIDKIYVVVTAEKIWVRRLNNKKNGLEFISDNPGYGKINILMQDLLELWEASAVYSTYLKPPTRIEERVAQLEKDYSEILDRINKMERKL
jgi:transcriptional regulator with XRE-family HTH domain